MKNLPLLLAALVVSACTTTTTETVSPEAPYQLVDSSRVVDELAKASFFASNQKTYTTRGYIQLFEPGYYVLVSTPDGRSLANDFSGASLVAQEVILGFDCANGAELVPGRSQYSAANNQWLIVADCKSGQIPETETDTPDAETL